LLPTLQGELVILRGLTAGDVPVLLEIFGDPDVARYLSIRQLRDDTDAHRFLDEIHRGSDDRTLFQWGVQRNRDSRLVGSCTLADIHWDSGRAEVGFALGRQYWGEGLMAAALPLLIGYGFQRLGLNRLEADVDPRNEVSIHLLEKFGFQREGLLRQRHLQQGERQDSLILGLLGSDWSSSPYSGSFKRYLCLFGGTLMSLMSP